MKTHRGGCVLTALVAMTMAHISVASGRAQELQLSADSMEIFGRAAVVLHLNPSFELQRDVFRCFLDIRLALIGEPGEEYGALRFDVAPWNGADDIAALKAKTTSSYWEQTDGVYCLDLTRALETAALEHCPDIALIDLSSAASACQVALPPGKSSLSVQLQVVRALGPDENAGFSESVATAPETLESPTWIAVAPNPVARAFRLRLPPDKAACPRLSLQLIDLQGRVVGRRDIRDSELPGIWALEDFGRRVPTGVYLLRVTDCRNAVSTCKITVLK